MQKSPKIKLPKLLLKAVQTAIEDKDSTRAKAATAIRAVWAWESETSEDEVVHQKVLQLPYGRYDISTSTITSLPGPRFTDLKKLRALREEVIRSLQETGYTIRSVQVRQHSKWGPYVKVEVVRRPGLPLKAGVMTKRYLGRK